jgi:hypothetical protein
MTDSRVALLAAMSYQISTESFFLCCSVFAIYVRDLWCLGRVLEDTTRT